MKNLIARLVCTVVLFAGAGTAATGADTAPDMLVKSVVEDVLAVIRDNKDPQTLRTLAEQKVVPHFDFRQMTQMAAGKVWREASASQQQALENAFRTLLVNTYTSALGRSSAGPKTIEVRPLPASAAQGEALVKTMVKEPGKPPVAIDYRMQKEDAGWKVTDVTIENISLVTNYRSTFTQEVARSGIDGLIKSLEEKSRSPTRGGMG